MEVQKHLNLIAVCGATKELSVQDNVCEDVDVLSNWRVCTSELEDEDRVELLTFWSKSMSLSEVLQLQHLLWSSISNNIKRHYKNQRV